MFNFFLWMVVQASLFQTLRTVQPFSLNIKLTCMQPPIYRRTQTCASLAGVESCYLLVEQRWPRSLHGTRHPIMLRRSL